MVVEGHLVFRLSDELEAVVRAVPVDGGSEHQFVGVVSYLVHLTSDLTLQGCKQLRGLLVLLVKLGTIERVRAEALSAQSYVPVKFRA